MFKICDDIQTWFVQFTQQTLYLICTFTQPMKTSWRRLEKVFRLRLKKTSWRRLQNVLIRTNMFALALRLQKTSWPRPIYSSWPYVFKTSSRRLSKTSSRHLQDVFQTSCKDIFETFPRRIIKLNCSCWHVFEKYSTRFWDVLSQRRLFTEEYPQVTLLLINLWWEYKICKRDKNFSSFSFSIYYTFSGCI